MLRGSSNGERDGCMQQRQRHVTQECVGGGAVWRHWRRIFAAVPGGSSRAERTRAERTRHAIDSKRFCFGNEPDLMGCGMKEMIDG
jgi:hypothetical protein